MSGKSKIIVDGVKNLNVKHLSNVNTDENNSDINSLSSCETMTSTSSSISDPSEEEDDDERTVIHDSHSPRPHVFSPDPDPHHHHHQSYGGGKNRNVNVHVKGSPRGRLDVHNLEIIESGVENLRLPDDSSLEPQPQRPPSSSSSQQQQQQERLVAEVEDVNLDKSGHSGKTEIFKGQGSRGGGGGGGQARNSDLLWKSGALFTLHSFGSEDKPIECEEWVDFVGKTMKEVRDCPESLCEKHFLTVLVAPLRNHLASAVVIEKIAVLLAMPFILTPRNPSPSPSSSSSQNPQNRNNHNNNNNNNSNHGDDGGGGGNLQKNLELIYLDTKVLPNLLYSCKLMLRRRRIARLSLNLNSNDDHSNDMVEILEEEDLDGMDKCMRLISYLVHIQKGFAVEFCDSVCILQAFPFFILRLDKKRLRLAVDTLSVLCQILRILPANFTIVEEL